MHITYIYAGKNNKVNNRCIDYQEFAQYNNILWDFIFYLLMFSMILVRFSSDSSDTNKWYFLVQSFVQFYCSLERVVYRALQYLEGPCFLGAVEQ